MIKLDSYDFAILHQLMSNSRLPISKLSRAIKCNRETVVYKLNRLVEHGIITSFNTTFNEDLIGLKHFGFYLQLTDLDKERREEITKYVANHNYITWYADTAGKWSAMCDLIIPQHVELKSVVKEILAKLRIHLDDYAVLNIVDRNYYPHKFLSEERTNASHEVVKKPISKKEKVKEPDKKDLEIMFQLNQNSRVTYAQIAQETKLSANAIKRRVKELETSSIIEQYHISISYLKFGYTWYGFLLKVNSFDEETEKQINQFFEQHSQVLYSYRYIGSWDYEIAILVKQTEEVRDFIQELRSKFPKNVQLIDMHLILMDDPSYRLPNGVFQ